MPSRRAKKREQMLLYRYGITIRERDALLQHQGGVCAICKSESTNWDRGWIIDHCHETETIRGILCHKCNIALGHIGDDPEKLEEFIKYLKDNLNIKKAA